MRAPTYWLIPQMPTVVKELVWARLKQERGTQSRSPMWVAGSRIDELSTLPANDHVSEKLESEGILVIITGHNYLLLP